MTELKCEKCHAVPNGELWWYNDCVREGWICNQCRGCETCGRKEPLVRACVAPNVYFYECPQHQVSTPIWLTNVETFKESWLAVMRGQFLSPAEQVLLADMFMECKKLRKMLSNGEDIDLTSWVAILTRAERALLHRQTTYGVPV